MYCYIGASVDGRLPFWCACFANKVLSGNSPTTVLNEKCDILGVKTYSDPFRGQVLQPPGSTSLCVDDDDDEWFFRGMA